MRSSRVDWGTLSPETRVLGRDRGADREEKATEDGGGDWSDEATSQGVPAVTRRWMKQ